jgi:flagellar biosynthesis protein FlhB
MAEDQSGGGEKEFEATEQKRREARREGNVAQSKEANTFALFAGIIIAAIVFSAVVAGAMFSEFSSLMYHADSYATDVFDDGGGATRAWLVRTLVKVIPLFAIMAALVLGTLVIQQSVAFSAKKIKIEFNKISPTENLKKKYGTKGLLDFLKDMAKMLFAGGLAAVFLYGFAQHYYASSAVQLGQFFNFTFSQVLIFGVFQFALAAIDLPLQRQLHSNKLKMSREDLKKEQKQSEGDPQLKQKRREKASSMSRNQMMQNVKTATVVMVNPEHYAVALKWDPDGGRAPVCVAKGVDHLAAKIRETAKANDIPIYRDPPSTRSIYRLVDIDEEIHPDHFAAVAAAISFVDRIRKQTGGM